MKVSRSQGRLAQTGEAWDDGHVNYFAHGFRFIDDPYFLAGTAIPDWLGVADRSIRLPPRKVEPWLRSVDPTAARIVQGILQHHDDDATFHSCQPFGELMVVVGRSIRQRDPDVNDHVAGLLAHIIPELLWDACLIDDNPDRLDDYYRAVASIDVEQVSACISMMSGKEPVQLPRFIEIFLRERFLADYRDDERLLYRLSQIIRRAGLGSLPNKLDEVLPQARIEVARRASALQALLD